jgi:cation:H+ antiporter
MTDIWLAACAILAGFAGLIWSADRFVDSSAAMASNLGVPKFIIGLTVVAFGTSAPEIVVSISAALKGNGDLAVGNALGSNLANIGLVLGVTALIAPLPIQRHLLSHETPILLLVTAVAGYCLFDGKLSMPEGFLLMGSLIPVLSIMVMGKKGHETDEGDEFPELDTGKATLWFVVGLALLILSSETLVWGATEVALAFGVSPLIIGLTVIAIGTSLPELAASVMSALRGHHDIALGNIIGSNIFNLLVVLSVPALIQQPEMNMDVFFRDYAAVAGITLFLAIAMLVDYGLRANNHDSPTPAEEAGVDTYNLVRGRIGKRIGSLLLLAYFSYYWWLFS